MKKGIGSVVANVLIVLLVIVGVGILWAAIRPLIGSANNRVQPDCLTVDLDVVSCVYDIGTATVVVKRGVGEGDLRAMKFAFSYENGDPTVSDKTTISDFDELETSNPIAVSGFIQDPKSVIAIAMIGPEEVLCNPTGSSKECT